ncbi:MAG: 16S rRNA (guanine(527)-N(7))-methyltransferase RsmG [Rhodocyclaceae bacterium]|nr:16S rRNA (guanine(527)-N(7))-methyltransferase RsmG [Rhodocyclaceae bacterium]
MSLGSELDAGLEALGVPVSEGARNKLLAYVELLLKWNRVYNLTAVRDPSAVLATHILDSLSVLPHLPVGCLVDIGSGGGLPGIVLAICDPARSVTLVESNQKKSAFQRQVQIELGLSNVNVLCARAENVSGGAGFDVVISRAFSSLLDFVGVAGHLCKPSGCLAAMKGIYPEAEIAELPSMFHVEQSIALKVPFVLGARHLILIRRS